MKKAKNNSFENKLVIQITNSRIITDSHNASGRGLVKKSRGVWSWKDLLSSHWLFEMLNPWVLSLAKQLAPRIMLPFSMFIGYIGKEHAIRLEDLVGCWWLGSIALKLENYLSNHREPLQIPKSHAFRCLILPVPKRVLHPGLSLVLPLSNFSPLAWVLFLRVSKFSELECGQL